MPPSLPNRYLPMRFIVNSVMTVKPRDFLTGSVLTELKAVYQEKYRFLSDQYDGTNVIALIPSATINAPAQAQLNDQHRTSKSIHCVAQWPIRCIPLNSDDRPGLFAIWPMLWRGRKRGARRLLPYQSVLPYPPVEHVKPVPTEERLAVEDHKRHTAMAGMRLHLRVRLPLGVSLRRALLDVFNCLVAIETFDPVEAFLDMVWPMGGVVAPNLGRHPVDVVDTFAVFLAVARQPYNPHDGGLLFRRVDIKKIVAEWQMYRLPNWLGRSPLALREATLGGWELGSATR